MVYDPGALNASLAAAVGNDGELMAELQDRLRRERRAPARPARPLALRRQLAVRRRPPEEHRRELRRRRPVALADEALTGAPGDPAVLRKIAAALDEFGEA